MKHNGHKNGQLPMLALASYLMAIGDFKMRRVGTPCSVLILLVLTVLMSACASIYTAPDFGSYKFAHSKIAILPFDVTIETNPESGDLSARDLQEMEKEQGETFQRVIYTQFLHGQQRGRYTVEFQDIDKTNTLLSRELETNTTPEELTALTKAEICKILDVDAVIGGNMLLSRPIGTDRAMASRFLIGLVGNTNKAFIRMSIYEGDESKLLWNYEHVAKGGLLSSPESVARAVMKGAARTFPYKQQN
ncbi:MAG: hypothetical protein F4X44_06165 [Gammaproteobacteria bacterium]|nr:hypothetical protein [Gammaproteobacteria bacterium]MYD80177.1 hypothetical protein [Gammaproteobacteria bacterium]